MARGTMYEIVSETKLKLGDTDICKLKEEDLYDYVGTEFDYCQDCDRKDGVSELMDYFKNSDFETGTDKLEVNGEMEDIPYIIVTQEAKEAYFKKSYEEFMEKVKGITLEKFATDTYDISQLIAETYGDAARLDDLIYWFFDNCVRNLEPGEKYYFGNTVYMH